MDKSIDQQIRDAESCIKLNLKQRGVDGLLVYGLMTLYHPHGPRLDDSRIEICNTVAGSNLITKVFELFPQHNIAVFYEAARGSLWQRAKNKRVDDVYALVEQLGYDILPESRATRERLAELMTRGRV